jgi:hypothetical protein
MSPAQPIGMAESDMNKSSWQKPACAHLHTGCDEKFVQMKSPRRPCATVSDLARCVLPVVPIDLKFLFDDFRQVLKVCLPEWSSFEKCP